MQVEEESKSAEGLAEKLKQLQEDVDDKRSVLDEKEDGIG